MEKVNNKRANELIIVGTGSGIPEYITPVAQKELKNADYVIASKRIAESLKLENTYKFSTVEETEKLCAELLKKGTVAVAVSGDPLMYSFLATVQRDKLCDNIRVIPSLGAIQLMGAKFGITTENARIISVHGRDADIAEILNTIKENEKTFFFCDKEHSPSYIASLFHKNGFDDVTVYVGANLTLEDEIAEMGSPEYISKRSYPPLAMAVVVNKNTQRLDLPFLLDDDSFLRNETPMTKAEVRAVIMLKLGVRKNSVVWDIGAGTGSISIECAKAAMCGKVFSIECNENAVKALKMNKERFSAFNMEIVQGNAVEMIRSLPKPDIVFIGGTGKYADDIFKAVTDMGEGIRVVMSAVTLETKAELLILKELLQNSEIMEMNISKAADVGSYTIMKPNNAVMILSGYTL